jgi:glycosyltransferase involved in cell wall biosynthesis
MKKVCILPAPKQNATGGVAQHILALSKGLAACGWEVVDNVEDADIVHAHAVEQAPVVDVFTCHGIHPLKENMPAWQVEQNRNVFANLKHARRVIAVSEWSAQQWAPLLGLHPTVIPNAIDEKTWRKVPKGRWRERLGIDESSVIILYSKSYVSEVLDPTPAIEIARRFPEAFVVTPLTMDMLHSAPKNLLALGAQTFENMQMLLQDSDVFLAVTRENHSIMVLEAMLLAKPIAGFDWGGTSETIVNGVSGLLVEPGNYDALANAVVDALERSDELGAAARQRVLAEYQWKDAAKRIADVYDAALQEKLNEASPNYPLCSIVIPVYNKSQYIAATLKSAMNQQGVSFEIIVLDDGSTDNSLQVIRQTVEGWPGQCTVVSKANSGVADTRNCGIAKARGRYIMCLDADDLIDRTALLRLSGALQSDPFLGIAYSDFVAFTDTPEGRQSGPVTCDEYNFDKLKRGNILPCCNLFRRKAYDATGGYKPDIDKYGSSWEDYELWLNMGKLGWYGQRVPLPLFWYRKIVGQGRDFTSQPHVTRLRGYLHYLHRDLYTPTVSIVIPCYKQSQFLREAIDSALAQTFMDIEVIVVDDGNEPEEEAAISAVVDSYLTKSGDPPSRVRLIVHEQNQGLATARNTAIAEATGKWIVPLDADDVIQPEFIETCLDALHGDLNKFAYVDSLLWHPSEPEKSRVLEAEDYKFTDLLRHINWSCTVMYAKDAWTRVGGYKEAMSKAGGWEDWEFAVALGEIGVCGQHVHKTLFWYRQHSPTQMRNGTRTNKVQLQNAMKQLHTGTYRGEFPTMCCGRPGPQTPELTRSGHSTSTQATRSAISREEQVLVRYVGSSIGSKQWRSPLSGNVYSFGLSDPLHTVPRSDAEYLAQLPSFVVVQPMEPPVRAVLQPEAPVRAAPVPAKVKKHA